MNAEAKEFHILSALSDNLTYTSNEIREKLQRSSHSISLLEIDIVLKALENENCVTSPALRKYTITDTGMSRLSNLSATISQSQEIKQEKSIEIFSHSKKVKKPYVPNDKPRTVKLFEIFLEIGKPMYYKDLTARYGELFDNDVKANTIYTTLSASRKFVLLGQGVFSLEIWDNSKYDVKDFVDSSSISRDSETSERLQECKIILANVAEPLHYSHVHKIVLQRGNLASDIKAQTIYSTMYSSEIFNSLGDGCFGLAEWSHFKPFTSNLLTGYDVTSFIGFTIGILQNVQEPVHYLKIHENLTENYSWSHPIYYTLALLKTNSEFRVLKGLHFGLSDWYNSNAKKEHFAQILRLEKRPLHYKAIYDCAIESGVVESQNLSASNTAATLYSNDEFVSLGNGYYGLSEWKHVDTSSIPLSPQSQRKLDRTKDILAILEHFNRPLHYRDIHRILLAEYNHDDELSQQLIFSNLNNSDEFHSFGNGIFSKQDQNNRFYESSGERCLHICPRPFLHPDNVHFQLLDSVLIAGQFLQEDDQLTASAFYRKMSNWAGVSISDEVDTIQEHFDSWYMMGLFEFVNYSSNREKPLTGRFVPSSINDLRRNTLNSICRRLSHSVTILQIIRDIYPASNDNVAKRSRLIGGYSINYREILSYFESLEAIVNDNSTWRISSLGTKYLLLDIDYHTDELGEYYEQPDFVDDSNALDWEEDLRLLD